MRILFISTVFAHPYEPTRGAFNVRLAEALARRQQVQVVCPVAWVDECAVRLAGREHPSPEIPGVECHFPRYYYPPKVLRGWYGQFLWHSVCGTLKRLVTVARPDAIVAYWAHPDGQVAIRLARTLEVPVVVMVGGSDVLLLTRQRRRRQRVVDVLTAADAVIAVGANLRDRVISLGIAPAKVHIVPRGVDTRVFYPGSRAEARRSLGILDGPSVLLTVGRMVPVKGPDVLLRACTRLRERGVPCRLYFAGDGPLRPRLKREVMASGLSDTVTFLGPLSPRELGDWYRAAELTILPSRSEGVPNVLRESLACGTPFVASNVGGVAEVAAGSDCRLVPPEDPEALAEAIACSLAVPVSLPPVGGMSWDESAAALVGIIEPLVRSARDRACPYWPPVAASVAEGADRPPARSWRGSVRAAMSRLIPRRLLTQSSDIGARHVCLTFDDGPHPEHTPRLLDVLREHDVPATFFVVGCLAERYPGLVRRMAAEGHAVGNHSFSHPRRLGQATRSEQRREVERTNRVLATLLGRPPTVYRPPYGHVTVRLLLRVWRAGMTTVLWNVDPKDYLRGSAQEVQEWFQRRPLRAGDLVLMHDRLPYAAEVLPEVIGAAREAGLTFAPVPAAQPTSTFP